MGIVVDGLNGSQPQFVLSVFMGKGTPAVVDGTYKNASKGKSSWLDIEPYVEYPVEYAEEQSLLNRLSFTIGKATTTITARMRLGQSVRLYGYYYTKNGSEMRLVFQGTITRMRVRVSDNGSASCSVEAIQYGFIRSGMQKRFTSIPNPDDLRPYLHGKKAVRLRNVIEGLISGCNMEVGEIRLPASMGEETFTTEHQEFQRNQSDWDFLVKLANKYGCFCYIQRVNNYDRVFFTDKAQQVKQIYDDVEFRLPTVADSVGLSTGSFSKGLVGSGTYMPNIRNNEVQKFTDSSWNRVRILRDISIDEDIDQAYAVTRTSSFIDPKTGELKNGISTTKDGKITFYELDESKVEYVKQHFPDIANKIMYSSPADFPWKSDPTAENELDPNYAAYYYTQVTTLDEQTAVYDQAYRGITITGSCNMDLNIRSQRAYRVNGIFRWSSGGTTQGTYFLRGLKQVWDSSGNRTELDFIK